MQHRQNIERVKTALIILFLSFIAVACTSGYDLDESENPMLDRSVFNDPELNDLSPKLRLMLTDAPADNIDNVWLTVSSVTINSEEHGWISISNDTQTLDLLRLQNSVSRTLGIATLPAGSFTEMRMLVTDASVVVEGSTHDLYVPSGATSGVKIKFHFTVSDSEISTMLIDWDASSSIHYAPGEGYIMRPVIHVRSFRTEELDTTSPAKPVVTSPSHPENNQWFAENTAEFHFTGTDDVGMDGFSYTFDQVSDTTPDEIADRTLEDTEPEPCQPVEYLAQPTCTIIEPSVVLENSIVNIYGTNFGSYDTQLNVTIGGETVEVLKVTPAQIMARVPSGLGKKAIEVTTPKGTVTCANQVSVVADTAFCPDGQFEPGKGLLGKVYPTCDNHSYRCVLPDFSTLGEPQNTITACQLDIPTHRFEEGFPGVESNLVEWFAIRFTASLDIQTSGTYQFKVNSDDGSKLFVDNRLVVNNDGVHAPQTKYGSVYLEKGEHDFVVEYFQGPRVLIALQVWWTPPGGREEIIPKDVFLMPRNPAAGAEMEKPCFCSGHGEGVYNYRAYGANDGTGKMYYVDMYADESYAQELGTLKGKNNRTLTDFEAMAILDGVFYGINNSGHSTIKNRLYRILKDQAAGGIVPTEEIGVLRHNHRTISEMDCLAVAPDNMLYGISSDTEKLYRVNTDNAELTEIMDVAENIEGAAFGPSGVLYAVQNVGALAKLLRIVIDEETIDEVAVLPFNTQVESLGWHPDGFLYAGIDNTSNDYPAIAKIRPTDGVVVETLDPSIELDDIEGLDFDYSAEAASCACDMELEENPTISGVGNLIISDDDGDGFSEQLTFVGDQYFTGISYLMDEIKHYTGSDFTCNKPKSRVSIAGLSLSKDDLATNRFGFASATRVSGISIELLKPDCSYETVVTGDLESSNEYVYTTNSRGQFWLRLSNPVVTNNIGSRFLAALTEQDEPAAVMFNFQLIEGSDPVGEMISDGVTINAITSFTIQPGENQTEGADEEELPLCPDPTLHDDTLEGSAIYSNVPDGVWFFHVRSVDDSGNWGPVTHYQVMIDNSAPDAPIVTSPTHPSEDMSYPNTEPKFEWTASDLSGIKGYSYVIDNYSSSEPDDTLNGTDLEKQYQELEPSTYWFHIKAQNNAGLFSETAHYKITILDPDVNFNQPPPGLIPVPRTIYLMGSPEGHNDRFTDEQQHWVEVFSYAIMMREVSNADYKKCRVKYELSDTDCNTDLDCEEIDFFCNRDNKCQKGCANDPTRNGTYSEYDKSNHPVANVDWYDADEYCRANGMRLPTEAEWEFAAKGEDAERYPWGDNYDEEYANGSDLMLEGTLEVDSFDGEGDYKDGRVCYEYGCLVNMSGNVEEWVADFYHKFPDNTSEANPIVDPHIATMDDCIKTCQGIGSCIAGCSDHVARGGSFFSDKSRLRVFYRERHPELYISDTTGFRCAMDWNSEAETPDEVCDGVDNDYDKLIDEGFDNTDNDELADCVDTDDDGDGVEDDLDNCPLTANADQADPDLDGYGEVCDPDGEILPVSYKGLIRPFDVAIDNDGTIYVAGSEDNESSVSSTNNTKYGTVMSIGPQGYRTGQVYLTSQQSGSQWKDYRPGSIQLSSLGYLYVTDTGSSYDDGIWKIARNSNTNQLGSSVSPTSRNGEAGSTERFAMGDNSSRGIDKTSGSAIDKNAKWIYVSRKNAWQIMRYPLELDGSVSDELGSKGGKVASVKRPSALAIDSRGWLYYLRDKHLYRQKVVDDTLSNPERISDGNAFRNTVALAFDKDDNMYALRQHGKSNKWPFIGNSVAYKTVPSESGFISMVSKTVLDEAHNSNQILHGQENKQLLLYGGPGPIEIVFNNKRLNSPQGFVIDHKTGNIIVANTDSDEVVVLSLSKQKATVIDCTGEYRGLE